jgi:large subunit ribosomal protein L15
MKLKKRKKNSRIRGARTCGYGFRQKHKGHGNDGGRGMSGSGKRADQKKQKGLMIAYKAGFETYFGKRGFTSASKAVNKIDAINLRDVKLRFGHQSKIELKKHKILGEGEGFKAIIEARAASATAIEKMEKAGGKIIIPIFVLKEIPKVEAKVEKKEEGKKSENAKISKTEVKGKIFTLENKSKDGKSENFEEKKEVKVKAKKTKEA